MITEKAQAISRVSPVAKLKDYAQFIKLRLASLVVFSAITGYLLSMDVFIWQEFMALVVGGFLVTGASNGFNQIIEKDLDKLMDRTADRPLPGNRMGLTEAFVVASLCGVAGLSMLWYFLNPLSGWLGALALVLYVAAYTPLKRVTPFAVFVGAIPGAIPPMLGWVAATGKFGLEPGLLFAVQFMWQFPHFWAIAWKADEDYKKAGFKLLPSKGGKNKASAFQMLVYSLFLIPVSLLPFVFNITGLISVGACLLLGGWFLAIAWKLYKSCEDKDATKLMFASFLYLPLVLIIFVIDKV